MTEGWQPKSLGSVILPGATVDPTSMPDKPFHYVDVSSVSNKTFEIESSTEMLGRDAPSRARRQIRTGDVIFATIRPTLKRIAVVPNRLDGAVCSTAFFVFRPQPTLDGKFLYYYLFTDGFMGAMDSLQAGASYPAVNDTQIKAQRISLPTIPEQKRIVAILDEAFEGIDTAIANTEKNLVNARELFETYLWSVFSLEADWVKKTVGELADHSLGKMLDKQKNRGALKPYLRNLNVRWFGFDLDDVLQMPFEDDEADRYTAIKGDVLMCEGGYPGRCAIWDNDERIYIQKAIHRIRFKQKHMNKWFVYFVHFLDMQDRLRGQFTGSGIQHFTGQALHRFHVPLPPPDDLGNYVVRFDAHRDLSQELEAVYRQKLAHLKGLKQAILQKAFSGELTERSVEAVQEAAE